MNIRKKPGELLTSAATPEKLLSIIIRYGRLLKTGRLDKAILLNDLNKSLTDRAVSCRAAARPMRISGLSGPGVYLYSDMAAYFVFLSYNISLCPDESELENHITYIADFLGKCMSRPRGGMLEPSEVESLLNIVQYKFGFINAVTFSRDLDIYLINRSHMYYDSFLLTYKRLLSRPGYSGTSVYRDKWMLFCLSPCLDILACNKYYVFLHEIGHILYNALTRDGEEEPELFGEIAFLLGFPIFGAGHTDNASHPFEINDKQDELFADLFAAASLYKTCYWHFNPFKDVLSEALCDLLESYFSMLAMRMDRICKNPFPVPGTLH